MGYSNKEQLIDIMTWTHTHAERERKRNIKQLLLKNLAGEQFNKASQYQNRFSKIKKSIFTSV